MSTTLVVVLLLALALVLFLVWVVWTDRPSELALKQAEASTRTMVAASPETSHVDVLMVGAGAMSTTLAMLLKELDPGLKLCIVEKLDNIALESTDALNNAGTGHAGNCELNYTPQRPDGSIDTAKAFRINAQFEESLQFWSYLRETEQLPEPHRYINQVPHYSFVWGDDDIRFLRKRQELLSDSVAFGDMEFSADYGQLREWLPLMMENRSRHERIAATRVRYGTDVNFGSLARHMAKTLDKHDNMDLRTHRTVVDLRQQEDKRWMVELHNTKTGAREVVFTKKIFLGAGGGALPLLQMSGIKEGQGYGGFPVGGQWLICNQEDIIDKHWGKVYGKAAIGAPPMSVPHLDTRTIRGKRSLLFGPFAGFSTKYLKNGSLLDFPRSMQVDNLIPMVVAGLDNVPLTIYLIKEVLKNQKARVETLRQFYGEAKVDEWKLEIAGQRVQIIKQAPGGGKLEFGTEVVCSGDGTLAALLGASPGASTAVNAMLSVIERCFDDELKSDAWKAKLKEMIPSYGNDLLTNDDLFREVRARNNEILKIDEQA